MKRATRTASRSGFTLLEILVALMVFSMAAVVLGSAYLNILNGYTIVSRGTGEDQDVAFARQQLFTQADMPTAQNGDEFDTIDNRHVKWTAVITPTNTTDLFAVTFTCIITSASAQTQTQKTEQSFMLLRPTWSDPTSRSTLRQAAASRIAQLQGKQS